MTKPNFGYSTTRPNDESVPVTGADFSTIGIVTTAADADAAKFPLDEPVRFTSTDPAYLAAAGVNNYLSDALAGINAQLKGYGADVAVVRVAEGAGGTDAIKLAATQANIIGSAGSQTGLWALRAAGSHVKMSPKLVAVPGYTAQQVDPATDNPVRAALGPHLDALKAISPVDVDVSSKDAAIAARELMSSDRMMPIGIAARVFETVAGAATLVTRPMSPRVLGLFVQTDTELGGGEPFEPIANRAVQGLAGINRPIGFDLGDGSTEAQLMLAADIAVVVAGEIANPGAIADGGFVFLGVESAATGDLWSQIHQVRSADYLDLKMASLTREYLGGRITPRRAEAWLNALKFMLLNHVNEEDILGFKLDFPKIINSVEDVRLGELAIETRIEPAPVFRRATNAIRRYRPAVDALIDAIVARAGSASAVVS